MTVIAQIAEDLKMTEPSASTGLLIQHGNSVPADGTGGYAIGCVFQHIDGGDGDALYVNVGTADACDFNPLVEGLTATAAELNQIDGALLTGLTPGTGISTGVGTICVANTVKVGTLFHTTILIDLTGLNSGGTIGDIIGKDGGTANCHIGQIRAAANGTIVAGRVTCFETPVGGDPDINIYSATVGTGAQDAAIGDLTETGLINHGDWTAEDIDHLDTMPVANGYLYLTCGAATDADYTAGKLLIELWGA